MAALLLSGALVVGGSGIAQAQPVVGRAPDAVARHVMRSAAAAGAVEAVTNDVQVAKGIVSGAEGTTVVDAGVGNAVVDHAEGRSFVVEIPFVGGAVQSSTDGTTAVIGGDGSHRHFMMAVNSLREGGARAQAVLLDRQAPREYSYAFVDADSISLTPTGGAVVYSGTGADRVAVAEVAAPWARDAAGRDVPTRYEVRGNSLVQVVDHTQRQFAYPIVADPSWSEIWAAIKAGGSRVASAAKWLGSKAGWVVGKTWAGVTSVAPAGYRAGKFLVKKVGPGALVLCATGAGWAWYRADSHGWVLVGDVVAGCLF